MTVDQFCWQLYHIRSSISNQSNESPHSVLPLSLLAFVVSCEMLSYPSVPANDDDRLDSSNQSQIPQIDHMFRRHVNPKKQHEIKQLGKLINEICERTGCRNIIDMGCGQGHLARYLAFHYQLYVTAVEAVGCHLTTASRYDQEVSNDIVKIKRRVEKGLEEGLEEERKGFSGSVAYIEHIISPNMPAKSLLARLGLSTDLTGLSHLTPEIAQSKDHNILIGLHTCGDLASTMFRTFNENDNIVGLVSVGCCYMKLSCDMPCNASHDSHRGGYFGYPLSTFVNSIPKHDLSYEAREVACHSRDVYMKKLQDGSSHLMIHCYRAAVETIFRLYGIRRPQLKIKKSISKLPFERYASSLLASVGIEPRQAEFDTMRLLVNQWNKVVIFFLLRLTIAPCVETLLMMDRLVFLLEKGFHAKLTPCFNPMLSPRNLVITASRL